MKHWFAAAAVHFRCHESDCAVVPIQDVVVGSEELAHSKVTKEHMTLFVQQNVRWLDIAMSKVLNLMTIVHRWDQLRDVVACFFICESSFCRQYLLLETAYWKVVHHDVHLLALRVVNDFMEFNDVLVDNALEYLQFFFDINFTDLTVIVVGIPETLSLIHFESKVILGFLTLAEVHWTVGANAQEFD